MTEEEKKAYEILYEKIIFVDKYRMLKPHWIKFHNYIEKLQKENEELEIKNCRKNQIIYAYEERTNISEGELAELIDLEEE